jgi:hypothetical protein
MPFERGPAADCPAGPTTGLLLIPGLDGRPRHCLEPNGSSREADPAQPEEPVWYAAYRGEDERDAEHPTARLPWNRHFDSLVERVSAFLAVEKP